MTSSSYRKVWDKNATIRKAYKEATGREPSRLPADDPLAWQYDYQGTRDERERLEREVEGISGEPPVEQTSLFEQGLV